MIIICVTIFGYQYLIISLVLWWATKPLRATDDTVASHLTVMPVVIVGYLRFLVFYGQIVKYIQIVYNFLVDDH